LICLHWGVVFRSMNLIFKVMENKMISERTIVIAIAAISVMLIGSCDSINVEKVQLGKNPEIGKKITEPSKNVGSTTSYVDFANGILSRLQKCKYISIDFNAEIVSNNEFASFSAFNIDNSPPLDNSVSCPLVWSGTSFSANFDYTWKYSSGETVHNTGTISGIVSETGLNLNSLTAHETSDYPTEEITYYYDISVKNVPFQSDYECKEYSPRFSAEGASVGLYISLLNIRWDYIDFEGVTQSFNSISVNYHDQNNKPYLHITFLDSF
jgi:hypothetical protein